MRKLILMTSAAIIAPLSGFAEDITCTATPNCADLGYTSTTSCDNGVKCPWGEAWFCPPQNPEVCEIGSILYSDMTCYKEAQAGKTPIGVVVYVDATGAGQAMALKSLDTKYEWGYGTDILGLTNYTSESDASTDYDSCGNTEKIMAQGDKDTYPAAWAANEYSTEGTSAGDWCLPAAGIFTSIYNNQSVINTGFSRAGGTKFTSSTSAWSSSELDREYACFSAFRPSYGLFCEYSSTYVGKGNSRAVRPVFEFVQTFEGMRKGSFKYTCSGEGYSGGLGNTCNGKYSECMCSEGYEWWLGKCTPNCEIIGNILYSDKTCSRELETGKTPIGVVVYVDGLGGGQALALKSLDSKYTWGGRGTDISGLTNYTSGDTASQDYDSCGNTEKIMAQGDKDTYPAAWAANEYSTEGTSAGDWCLPAAGIITSYHDNQDAINSGFTKASGTKFTSDTNAWSSSEYDSEKAWYSYLNFFAGLYIDPYYYKDTSLEVRPVIEF